MSSCRRSKYAYLSIAAFILAGVANGRADAEQIRLSTGLSHRVLAANEKQTVYLKIGMTGFEMEAEGRRASLNVALVMDKSGSMAGDKIRKAREAAALFAERLNRDDIISVVAYDKEVQVLVPATKASDRKPVYSGIEMLRAGGSTALYAGVSKGASETRKFLDRERINSVILLSDGLANVGPRSTAELAALGASLTKEGISVTTLGLGLDYNEDLMTQLAMKGDGNHAFIEKPESLTTFFDLVFGAVASVVAQEVSVKVTCADGVRPVKVLGPDADIEGRGVIVNLNQLYSGHERAIIVELEVPPTDEGKARPIATVDVSYANMMTRTTDGLTSSIETRSTKSREEVEKGIDPEVMSLAIERISLSDRALAVNLRDGGKMQEARKLLLETAERLGEHAKRLKSEELHRMSERCRYDADRLDRSVWRRTRKQMRDDDAYRMYHPKI